MRPLKRALVFASEVGILLVGLVLSMLLGAAIAQFAEPVGGPAMLVGMLLTVGGWLLFHRKLRPWKLEYDVAAWELSRAELKQHPGRARRKGILRRSLVWIPSAVAAMVLLYFPAMSHLAHPSSRYLAHYRVPIPWSCVVFPMSDRFIQALGERDGSGLFGMTSFWLPHLDFSSMLFSSVPADLDAEWFNHKMAEKRREGASEVATREFRLDTATLTCWQYIPSPRRSEDLSGPAYWWPDYEATCQTAVGALDVHFLRVVRWSQERPPSFLRHNRGRHTGQIDRPESFAVKRRPSLATRSRFPLNLYLPVKPSTYRVHGIQPRRCSLNIRTKCRGFDSPLRPKILGFVLQFSGVVQGCLERVTMRKVGRRSFA